MWNASFVMKNFLDMPQWTQWKKINIYLPYLFCLGVREPQLKLLHSLSEFNQLFPFSLPPQDRTKPAIASNCSIPSAFFSCLWGFHSFSLSLWPWHFQWEMVHYFIDTSWCELVWCFIISILKLCTLARITEVKFFLIST
jgi:hypothetical protein